MLAHTSESPPCIGGVGCLTAHAAPRGLGDNFAISVITFGYRNAHTGHNAAEHTLGPVKAHGLHKLLSFDVGGATISEPSLAVAVRTGTKVRDLVSTSSEDGSFFAVDAVTGKLVWRRQLGAEHTSCTDMPGGVFGASSTPAINPARRSPLLPMSGPRVERPGLRQGVFKCGRDG